MVDPVVIVVAPVGRGRFCASVGGRVLIDSSTTPFLDAARVLAGEGVNPATRIVMRHQGKDYDALTSTVGTAATLDVKGDHFVKYRPRVEGTETADQTAAHASEQGESIAAPPRPSSAPGGAAGTFASPGALCPQKGRRAMTGKTATAVTSARDTELGSAWLGVLQVLADSAVRRARR